MNYPESQRQTKNAKYGYYFGLNEYYMAEKIALFSHSDVDHPSYLVKTRIICRFGPVCFQKLSIDGTILLGCQLF